MTDKTEMTEARARDILEASGSMANGVLKHKIYPPLNGKDEDLRAVNLEPNFIWCIDELEALVWW